MEEWITRVATHRYMQLKSSKVLQAIATTHAARLVGMHVAKQRAQRAERLSHNC